MLELVSKLLNNENQAEQPNIQPKNYDVNTASKFVQKWLADANNSEWIEIYQEALSGRKDKQKEYVDIVLTLLNREMVTVDGMSQKEAAKEIVKLHCSLEEIEPFYADPAVDEVRVAPGGRVCLTKRGKHQRTDIYLSDDKITRLIERLTPYSDTGVSLDESNPNMGLVRPDGYRLTAFCNPITKTHCFALRKLGNIELSPENFIKMHTFDKKVWNILSLFARSRRNILVCGGVNSGKTTLIQMLVGELHPNLAIRVLDIDNELRISELYPDRDIWELEAHPEVKADLSSLFAQILRISPDVIIVPEFRGIGETWITIEACTRGHEGSMASAHFTSLASAEEVVRNIGMLAIQEGVRLPLDAVTQRVAQAFQIIVQTFSDTIQGVKKITAISEVVPGKDSISVNPLVKWYPYTENFVGPGEWKVLNLPTPKCCEDMRVFGIPLEEIKNVFQGKGCEE